jgi:hypothetical protein
MMIISECKASSASSMIFPTVRSLSQAISVNILLRVCQFALPDGDVILICIEARIL